MEATKKKQAQREDETATKRHPSEQDERETAQAPTPVLRFSPTAWAKLLYFRDRGHTEIGGFGISAADDLLRVEDFATVKQEVTLASVTFDDEAVADFFEDRVDAGFRPEQFGRIWLHTHPGESAGPSSIDEATFDRVFGRCEWAVMCIVARKNRVSARLRFNIGPGGETLIPLQVDYREPFGASNQQAWEAEYEANITREASRGPLTCFGDFGFGAAVGESATAEDVLAELEEMDPTERRGLFDELAARPDLWQETEVIDGL